jgi:hypothetical protein
MGSFKIKPLNFPLPNIPPKLACTPRRFTTPKASASGDQVKGDILRQKKGANEYLSLPPTTGNEPGPVPSMDEEAFNFVTEMIRKLRTVIQKRWDDVEKCIQENPSLGLVHRTTMDDELWETIHCLRPDASQLLAACGIDEDELGGIRPTDPQPQPSEPSAGEGSYAFSYPRIPSKVHRI